MAAPKVRALSENAVPPLRCSISFSLFGFALRLPCGDPSLATTRLPPGWTPSLPPPHPPFPLLRSGFSPRSTTQTLTSWGGSAWTSSKTSGPQPFRSERSFCRFRLCFPRQTQTTLWMRTWRGSGGRTRTPPSTRPKTGLGSTPCRTTDCGQPGTLPLSHKVGPPRRGTPLQGRHERERKNEAPLLAREGRGGERKRKPKKIDSNSM